MVAELNPYRLGATSTDYGESSTYGSHDPYVERTLNEVDARLGEAILSGRLVVIHGPSKAGKTRTAFEAVRAARPAARLLDADPDHLRELLEHPRVVNTDDSLILWLDDLDRFLLAAEPLNEGMLARLWRRQGETVAIATLRTEARRRLIAASGGELSRSDRLLLQSAVQIELKPTDADVAEQSAAIAAYPTVDLSKAGLAEQLAGAPAILTHYHATEYNDAVQHAVLQVAIDWARVGLRRPLPELHLCSLAAHMLRVQRPDMTTTVPRILEAIGVARRPLTGYGRASALVAQFDDDQSRSYRAFDYLVAADDGQGGQARPISEIFWRQVLQYIRMDEAYPIAKTAYERSVPKIALEAAEFGARAGDVEAMNAFGVLLCEVEPFNFPGAWRWFSTAANNGSVRALTNLGNLALMGESPDFDRAEHWYQEGVDAGSVVALGHLISLNLGSRPRDLGALRRLVNRAEEVLVDAADGEFPALMSNLGAIYATTPGILNLPRASHWLRRAAETGDVGAMNDVGYVLLRLQKPPDVPQGIYWLKRAADRGDQTAMVNLYTYYAKIRNPVDADEATVWATRAATAGVTDLEDYQRRLDWPLELVRDGGA